MGWRELKAASPARPEDLSALRSQVSAVLQAVPRGGEAGPPAFLQTFDRFFGGGELPHPDTSSQHVYNQLVI